MTQFRSVSDRRKNNDPYPYRDKAGRRHASGLTRSGDVYDPRPEFTPSSRNPENVILDLARDTYEGKAGDTFGWALGWLYATLQHWQEWQGDRIGSVPASFGFRNGGHSDSYDEESGGDWEYHEIREARPHSDVEFQDMIVHAAAVFDRLISQATLNGKDY